MARLPWHASLGAVRCHVTKAPVRTSGIADTPFTRLRLNAKHKGCVRNIRRNSQDRNTKTEIPKTAIPTVCAQHASLSGAGTQLLLSRLIKPSAKAKFTSSKENNSRGGRYEQGDQHCRRRIAVVGIRVVLPASPLMPVGPLASAATTDDAVTPVRWGTATEALSSPWVVPWPPLRLVQTSPPLLALNIDRNLKKIR